MGQGEYEHIDKFLEENPEYSVEITYSNKRHSTYIRNVEIDVRYLEMNARTSAIALVMLNSELDSFSKIE